MTTECLRNVNNAFVIHNVSTFDSTAAAYGQNRTLVYRKRVSDSHSSDQNEPQSANTHLKATGREKIQEVQEESYSSPEEILPLADDSAASRRHHHHGEYKLWPKPFMG